MTPDQQPSSIPPHTFLIVNGTRVYRLTQETISIGRQSDNDIVLANPHVSRHHAQLQAAQGYFILFDLDSTGGTSVNGEKISRKVLQPGDIISLAGMPVIYGQGKVREDIPRSQEGAWDELDDEKNTTLLVKGDEADRYLEMFDIEPEEEDEA
jgi:pSer/pThr/pTyr-binding forkhead associated (FHA) protein